MTDRLPDFFIVGQPKSGTTALYEMLRQHPEIYMSRVKEPRFFASDLPSSFQRHSEVPPLTYEDYLALFRDAGADQRAGEASTAYIWSHTAAGLIAKARPDARLIAILREPASFVRSMHLQLLQIRIEKQADLRKAVALEDSRREGRELPSTVARWPQVLLYAERAQYLEQLRRYRAAFPAEQLLVLIYDDFRDDNQAVVRSVLRFLDVDDTVAIEPTQANPWHTRQSREEDGEDSAPQQAVAQRRLLVRTAANGLRRAAAPRRELHAGAAQALQAGGRSARRVPRS